MGETIKKSEDNELYQGTNFFPRLRWSYEGNHPKWNHGLIYGEIIPFYGRKIQVSENIIMYPDDCFYYGYRV